MEKYCRCATGKYGYGLERKVRNPLMSHPITCPASAPTVSSIKASRHWSRVPDLITAMYESPKTPTVDRKVKSRDMKEDSNNQSE